MIYKAHEYQKFTTKYVEDNPHCGIFLDMGLGKTVSTLTAVSNMLFFGEASKVLVIGPKKVITMTWPSELQHWDHLRHLRYSIVSGDVKERKDALRKDADLYLISRDNVAWLISLLGGYMPFDTCVVDEISSFKNSDSSRFRALMQVRPQFDRFIGLTGTPAPNSLMDLFTIMKLIDMGKSLGDSKTGFRTKYFDKGRQITEDRSEYTLKKGEDWEGDNIYEVEIFDKIKECCISMKAVDHLDMPPLIEIRKEIVFDEELAEQYESFKQEKVLEIINDPDFDGRVTAANAAVLSGKLLQFTGGAVYVNEEKQYTEIHDLKLGECDELIEEANGNPVMIFYQFKHEAARLLKRYRSQGARIFESEQDLNDWNAKQIPILIVNPASAGHGLNFQYGGYIMIWYANIWSLELYEQAYKRLFRQGQTHSVIMYRLVVMGTMDEKVIDRLDKKEKGQNDLMDAVKAIIDEISEKILVTNL